MREQEFFNSACNSLRTYGNPYGGRGDRGWGWINPSNPNERCAVARFIPGDCTYTIYDNLRNYFNLESRDDLFKIQVLEDIIALFDSYATLCNDKVWLEEALVNIANKNKLQYFLPEPVSILEPACEISD